MGSFLTASARRAGRDKWGRCVEHDSLLFELLARFDGLSSRPGLLLLHGAGRGVLLHGREGVNGVEEGGDLGVGGQLGAVCA